MKRFIFIWLTAALTLLSGCSKDAEVIAFATKLDGFTNEVVTRVEQASDPKAGVDAAQQYLDSNQGDIKGAYSELQNVRGFQVKKESMERLTKSVTDNTTKVMGLKLKYVVQSARDKELDKKLDKLGDSFEAIFSGG